MLGVVVHEVGGFVGPRKANYFSIFSAHKEDLQVLAVVEAGDGICVHSDDDF